jgi:hypothetical protein
MNQTIHQKQLAELNETLAGAYGAPAKPMTKALRDETGAEPPTGQISSSQFMAKALTAHAENLISGVQLAEAEQCINAGQRPPERIVRAVMDGRAYSPWG